jgi:hypothetical protein
VANLSPRGAGVAQGPLHARDDARSTLADLGAAGAGSDNTLYALLTVIGGVVVVPTLIRGGVWGVEATLGAILCVLAGRALLVSLVLDAREWRRRSLRGR